MRKIMGMCLLAVCIPYIVTLAWTGRVEGNISEKQEVKRTVILDKGNVPSAMDLEEYLIGVVAMQIPASFEMETLKAQAVIARTYLCGQMGREAEIKESSLNLGYLEENQMEEMWGENSFLEYYKKIRDAVQDTRGQVITYEGAYIDPLFHRISAGKTRVGDALHPYLQPVDGSINIEAENYLSIVTYSRSDLAALLNTMKDPPGVTADQVLESIQIVEKDEAGYVNTVQVGTKSYSGEDISYILGLKSSAFSFEAYEDSVRCSVKGIGHGYGFDQYGADQRAKEGWKAEELLKFYYKDIVIVQDGSTGGGQNEDLAL